MRKTIIISALALMHTVGAFAESPADGNKVDASLFELGSLITPGETLTPGDLIKTDRQFQYWSLRCDVRPSNNKRLCSIEQNRQENGGIVWRIAANKSGKTVSVFALPARFDASRGLRLSFSNLDKMLDQNNFICNDNFCIGGFPFEGDLQDTIMKSDTVALSYFDKINGSEIAFKIPMTGFESALVAAARDPFGRDVSAQVAAQQVKQLQKAEQQAKAQSKNAKSGNAPAKAPTPKARPNNVAPKVARTKPAVDDGLF